jgi:hypothetical protein
MQQCAIARHGSTLAWRGIALLCQWCTVVCEQHTCRLTVAAAQQSGVKLAPVCQQRTCPHRDPAPWMYRIVFVVGKEETNLSLLPATIPMTYRMPIQLQFGPGH